MGLYGAQRAMKAIYDVPAPAKVNLFLHILGRRPDGYHLLQSVFMLIDWSDTLHFERTTSSAITRQDLTSALPEDDLILRAARALQHASGCSLGAHISIDKQIPAQAGMGGGSSDAASTLLALNRLWCLNFSLEKLAALGLKLGADVPFFLCGQHAWVQGIGEDMTPIQLPKARLLVAKPHAGLQTASIFSSPDLKRDTAADTISGFVETLSGQPVEKYFQYGRNDLQEVAQSLCPEVTLALNWLESLGLSGRMTGSGSAVFAHTSQDVGLHQAPQFLQTRLCFNLDEHPLKGWASSERVNGGP